MKCLKPIKICVADTEVGNLYFNELGTTFIEVPCSKCTACLANKRNEWVFRMHEHMQFCDTAYFVTLTYDDDHLPEKNSLDKENVKVFLHRFINDSQKLFQKKLSDLDYSYEERKKIRPHIKYFLVGEYGDSFDRPHYHFALFDFPGDKEELTRILIKNWPKAQIIPDVRYLSLPLINYLTKYMLKEFHESIQEHFENLGIEAPFRLISKGIGKDFINLSQAKRMIHSDGKPVKIYNARYAYPKYYRKKLTEMYYSHYNGISPKDKDFYSLLGLSNIQKKIAHEMAAKKYDIEYNSPENIEFQMNLRNKQKKSRYGK